MLTLLRRRTLYPLAAFCVVVMAASTVNAQGGQAPHPAGAPSAKIFKAFPVNTFLESIVATPDGAFLVSSYPDGKVYRIDSRGGSTLFTQIDGTIAGLAFQCPGDLLVNGWAGGKEPAVFKVSKAGKPELLLKLAGAMFPNGWSHLKGSRFLLADSFKGVIWEVDVAKKTARVWLQHELLARLDDKSQLPGVNGLKIFADTLYASNGQRQLLLRISLTPEGGPKTPEVFVKELFIDDFAFDTQGNLYGATHMHNSVVKVSPKGEITTVAGIDEGLAGSTAVAFGRGHDDGDSIFVTTNGGMSLPPPGGIQPGRVVRLKVGERGAPMCF
jgi:sugar lactone lactonase YvrE